MAAPFNDKGQFLVVKQGDPGVPVGIKITETYRNDGCPNAIRLNQGREVWDLSPAQARDLIRDLGTALDTYAELDRAYAAAHPPRS